jgi:tetratricopeptide (TPR) repeat protein
MALVKQREGKKFEAYQMFNNTVKYENDNGECWFLLAKSAAKINYYQNAIDAYEKACSIEPEFASYWLSYAAYLSKKGMLNIAIHTLKKALAYHSDFSLIDYRIAAYSLETGDYKTAKKHLTKALKYEPENFMYLFLTYPDAAAIEWVTKLIAQYNNQ